MIACNPQGSWVPDRSPPLQGCTLRPHLRSPPPRKAACSVPISGVQA